MDTRAARQLTPYRHLILTRAAYGPSWSRDENRRRLRLMRYVTARSLRSQTVRDFTWVVALDVEDQLGDHRRALVQDLGGEVVYVSSGSAVKARAASDAYRADWPRYPGKLVLSTRIDDDDALARDFVERLRGGLTAYPSAYIFPRGHRLKRDRCDETEHKTNAWVSLLSRDGSLVYDANHKRMALFYNVVEVDQDPAWLWVRHEDSLSGKNMHLPQRPVSKEVQRLYDVNWKRLQDSTLSEE